MWVWICRYETDRFFAGLRYQTVFIELGAQQEVAVAGIEVERGTASGNPVYCGTV
jgi:hypothetical protein